MINLEDYYLGVIIADMSYFNNPKRYRTCGNISYDPFNRQPFEVAAVCGVVTLLRKKDDIYYDEFYSRYKNELCYSLNEANKLGIVLAYVRPFLDFYEFNDVYYIKEDIENDVEMNEFILENYEYYISHSKLDKSDNLEIVDSMPMLDFHISYYNYLNDKFDEKKLIK